MCSFPDVKSAVNTAVLILQSGIPIARVEYLDENSIMVSNSYFGLKYPIAPTLFLEFTGSPQSVEEQTSLVSEFSYSLVPRPSAPLPYNNSGEKKIVQS